MRLTSSEYRRPLAKVEVSLAPLIDVMFLLLIFFMVATVFPENKGVAVRKPEMVTAGSIEGKTVTILVTKDGRYFMDGEETTLDAAARRVVAAKGITVVIESDRDARVESVTRALDAFKRAGAKSLAIAAKQAEDGEPAER